MEILSSPGIWLLIGVLAVLFAITVFTESKSKKPGSKKPKPSSAPRPKSPQVTKPKRGYTSPNATNSDRRFDNWQLAYGRKLANNQCEHTDTRTKKRCRNHWQEGDHFYDYAKGGATTPRNLVGACKWHNDPASPTLKSRNPEIERVAIEKRRKLYYPADEDVSVGEWRNTGLRITFSIGERVCQLSDPDPSVLVSDAKEALLTLAESNEIRAKISALSNPGELVDYIFKNRARYTLESLEGIDPESGLWVPLRKPTIWAVENLRNNDSNK